MSLEVPIAANPSGWTLRDRRLGGEHLGQRGVRAAVDEPEALAHAVGDREARDRLAVADRDDLEAEHAVEAVVLGDDVLAARRAASLPADDHLLARVARRTARRRARARRSSAARWLT